MMRQLFSFLDTDLYKLTMAQAVYHQFSGVNVEYSFKCRNKRNWTETHISQIKKAFQRLCLFGFEKDDLEYLKGIRFFKQDFIDFLSVFKMKEEYVEIYLEDEELQIKIKGPWLFTIFMEVPLLSIVNEIYFEEKIYDKCVEGKRRLEEKINMVQDFRKEYPNFGFTDFGTRRRLSFYWHRYVLQQFIKADIGLSGTSNIYFAQENNIKAIGTMAHEWLQAGQALDVRLVDSQKKMFQAWVDEYRGDLGIVLTDVIGIDAFLRDFDLYFSKLYDGVRHDSGDPFIFGEKIIAHYEKMKINPKTKTIVFSDGLDFHKAFELYKRFHERINLSFGIGTNLTNDVGFEPLQIVIKMTRCNGQPVAKISDSSGKGMCTDDEYIKYLKKVFYVDK